MENFYLDGAATSFEQTLRTYSDKEIVTLILNNRIKLGSEQYGIAVNILTRIEDIKLLEKLALSDSYSAQRACAFILETAQISFIKRHKKQLTPLLIRLTQIHSEIINIGLLNFWAYVADSDDEWEWFFSLLESPRGFEKLQAVREIKHLERCVDDEIFHYLDDKFNYPLICLRKNHCLDIDWCKHILIETNYSTAYKLILLVAMEIHGISLDELFNIAEKSKNYFLVEYLEESNVHSHNDLKMN